MEHENIQSRIRAYLWNNDDLLKNPDELYPLSHPLAGHCYLASEVLFHETGGYDEWQVERTAVTVREPGPTGDNVEFTHWYLRDRDTGHVVDLTVEQFESYEHDDVDIPYDEGTATGFMTEEPSERAQEVLDSLNPKHPPIDVPTLS